MPRHRIVSLIASATEIVAALGLERSLVGVSHECDYPPSIRTLPACSQPKIDVHAGSREIDRQVKALVEEALSVYRVDVARLNELRPTAIITQTQCEVCAVSLKDVEAAVCELVDSQPEVIALEPNSLADVWSDMIRVAAAFDRRKMGEARVSSLQRRLRELAERAARIAEVPRRAPLAEWSGVSGALRPRVACIEWIDPLMTAGNWVPELVELAGGTDLLGRAGEHSGYITWDDLANADPDAIAIMPCGFDISRTREELPVLSERAGWRDLKAVRSNRVYLTDGQQYFNRPGPRLVESAEILAEILHPAAFDFGHAGSGWQQ